MNEFTHGKQEKVSKIEFKEVLSDFLLGMAAGLKRDPIVILRIDGEDLLEFLDSPTFQPDATAIFSQIESTVGSLQDYMTKALEQLTVEHGMPPPSDPWVICKLEFLDAHFFLTLILSWDLQLSPTFVFLCLIYARLNNSYELK